jgi:hypothetical protein
LDLAQQLAAVGEGAQRGEDLQVQGVCEELRRRSHAPRSDARRARPPESRARDALFSKGL